MMSWSKFYEKVRNCDICFGEAYKSHKRILLGNGNINARVMIVGEAPSLYATGEGVVFGRKSWNNYKRMLDILGFSQDDVYTTNIVKCSIPKIILGDMKKCYENIFPLELRLVNPKYIILCGRSVVKTVLGKDIPLSGELICKKGRYYITCPHPMWPERDPNRLPEFESIIRKIKNIIDANSILDRWMR